MKTVLLIYIPKIVNNDQWKHTIQVFKNLQTVGPFYQIRLFIFATCIWNAMNYLCLCVLCNYSSILLCSYFAIVAAEITYAMIEHVMRYWTSLQWLIMFYHSSVAINLNSNDWQENVCETHNELQNVRRSFPKCIYASTSCRIYS